MLYNGFEIIENMISISFHQLLLYVIESRYQSEIRIQTNNSNKDFRFGFSTFFIHSLKNFPPEIYWVNHLTRQRTLTKIDSCKKFSQKGATAKLFTSAYITINRIGSRLQAGFAKVYGVAFIFTGLTGITQRRISNPAKHLRWSLFWNKLNRLRIFLWLIYINFDTIFWLEICELKCFQLINHLSVCNALKKSLNNFSYRNFRKIKNLL